MSLFSRLLGAAVQGAGARRAGLNAGSALRAQQERADAERERQERMEALRMALEQSQIRRNDAAAAKAIAPPPAPALHVMGRTLPDTPEGRMEAVQWREANRSAPRPPAPSTGGGSSRRTGATRDLTPTQARTITLRSANGEAVRMAAEGAESAGVIRVNLREKYPVLTEGEIQGIAQRAYDAHQRKRATTPNGRDPFTPEPQP